MTDTTTKTRRRKMARESAPTTSAIPAQVENKQPTRLDQIQQLLGRDDGASIAEMTEATGWQAHSIRGAIAGAIKKRGLIITSEKTDGVRRYRATKPDQ